jgi:hypothetical protein
VQKVQNLWDQSEDRKQKDTLSPQVVWGIINTSKNKVQRKQTDWSRDRSQYISVDSLEY